MECEAFYVFWAEVGRRMNMRDILESREAMIEWSRVCPLLALTSSCVSHSSRQDHEVKNMIAAETNKEVAEYTMAKLLSAVPIRFGLRSFAVRVSLCLLEDRVRVGMMYVFPQTARRSPVQYSPYHHRQPAPPWFIYASTRGIVAINWTAQRWFLLPRMYPSFPFMIDLPNPTGETCPKLHPNK